MMKTDNPTNDNRPEIRCSQCDGKGKILMGDELYATLQAVGKLGECTAREVLNSLEAKVGTTAINNRLEDLRKLKLITRYRRGMFWVYKTAGLVLLLGLLGGCTTVPRTTFTFNPVTKRLEIESPKNIELRDLIATVDTNGVLHVQIGSYISKNDFQIVKAVAEANAKMVSDLTTKSQELLNKAALAAGGL